MALVRYRRAYDRGNDTATGLYAALVADQLGKAADRDAILSQIANGPIGRKRQDQEETYRKLVAQLKETLPPKAAPRLKFVEVDKILATAPSVGIYAATLPGFVGIFLKNRGDLDGAKKCDLGCPNERLAEHQPCAGVPVPSRDEGRSAAGGRHADQTTATTNGTAQGGLNKAPVDAH